jgi:hypothetical protein
MFEMKEKYSLVLINVQTLYVSVFVKDILMNSSNKFASLFTIHLLIEYRLVFLSKKRIDFS